jgi:NADH-quinone oxidoreductase subunit A
VESYIGILVLVAVAAIICVAMVSLSWVLGPKKLTPYKSSPYECGVTPEGSARERFPIKFYLVAILFILFDIEVIFLWSWMTIYRDSDVSFQLFSFIEMLVYMSTWILGYIYAVRVGAIDWDETTSLDPAKLEDTVLPKLEAKPMLQPATEGS